MPKTHFHTDPYFPSHLLAERVVARIGLISDTHMPERWLALPPPVFDVLDGVDLVLHAGDVGALWVLDQLSKVAPVVAVHGNDDSTEAQRELPYQQVVTVGGRRILLSHTHFPEREQELASRRIDAWEPKLARWTSLGQRVGAAVLVFGHTHIPMALQRQEVLLVNPGAIASGNAVSRQVHQTVARLYILDGMAPYMVHIDLAQPGSIYQPSIDWQAGFAAALRRYSASILAPDLVDCWDLIYQTIWPLAPHRLMAALLRIAHRCWFGQQSHICRADFLSEAQADPQIPPEVIEALRRTL
ncbi:MAG: metallophosphoesterase family protein [Chloroflexi bacterium]|nr:metallophosphoesterase family protein [Chloroflexota bacterium]